MKKLFTTLFIGALLFSSVFTCQTASAFKVEKADASVTGLGIGDLTIITDIPGAVVSLNGNKIDGALTPMTLRELGEGTWKIDATANGKTVGDEIKIVPNQMNTVRLYFDPAKKKAAELLQAEKDYLTGYDYFDAKNYPKAFEYFSKAAGKDHPVAQYYVGYMYQEGYSVEMDSSVALKWYHKSAVLGQPAAQYFVGYAYEEGFDAEQDYSLAMEWYRKSAAQGNEYAKERIVSLSEKIEQAKSDLAQAEEDFVTGCKYVYGNGVEKNYSKAFEYTRKSALQGNSKAQNNLGHMYQYGLGASQDDAKALEWYKKSANQGEAAAQENLGDFYYYGIVVDEDNAKAFEWYQKAAKQDNAVSQYYIAHMYRRGLGVECDDEQAVYWYKKSSENGIWWAKFGVGWLSHKANYSNYDWAKGEEYYSEGLKYYTGEGCSQDRAEALSWFRMASKKGSPYAAGMIGYMYYNGYGGVEESVPTALEWFEKAMAGGNSGAIYNAARELYSGEHVKRNRDEAFKWMLVAAYLGDDSSMYSVGRMYKYGYGVKADLVESEKWLRRAKALGYKSSHSPSCTYKGIY